MLVALVFKESVLLAWNSLSAPPPLKKFARPLGPCALLGISPSFCKAIVSSLFGGAVLGLFGLEWKSASPCATTNSPLLFIKPGRPF